MAGNLGLWDGSKLHLWSLERTEDTAEALEAPDGLSALLKEHAPVIVAGAHTTARALPCSPLPEQIPKGDIVHIPPLSQEKPYTVTQGEEVAMAGFIATMPKFDGILCLPAQDSTLWVHVSAEEIVSMRRFLTGTMVRATYGGDLTLGEAAPFTEIVSDTMSRPEMTALKLAAFQAESTHDLLTASEAASRTTAAMIGAELAATRAYWLGQSVALIGAPALCAPYRAALEGQFVPLMEADEAAIIRTGFQLANDRLTA